MPSLLLRDSASEPAASGTPPDFGPKHSGAFLFVHVVAHGELKAALPMLVVRIKPPRELGTVAPAYSHRPGLLLVQQRLMPAKSLGHTLERRVKVSALS